MDRRKFLQLAGSVCVAVPCLNNKKATAKTGTMYTYNTIFPTDVFEIQTVNICTIYDMSAINFELEHPDYIEHRTYFIKISYKHKTETWSGKAKAWTDINNAGLTKEKPTKIIDKRLYVMYCETNPYMYMGQACRTHPVQYCEITLDKRISAKEYESLTKV